MVVDFLVFADVFLRVVSGGAESWEEIGYRYHEINFKDVQTCELALERWGDSLADMLEEEARVWWERELNVGSDDLRIETEALCEVRSS